MHEHPDDQVLDYGYVRHICMLATCLKLLCYFLYSCLALHVLNPRVLLLIGFHRYLMDMHENIEPGHMYGSVLRDT